MASDLLRPGLELVFCGYNPSLSSGLSGHHYAHPGNRFWRVLSASGITDRQYEPHDDETLLELGIGFTNLCSRPTRGADELTREEIRSGALALRQKPGQFRATTKGTWGVRE
jgi:double-stranded uracil-DNA glycosylase